MGFLLSKLLPLAVYPLGLALMLQILGLVWRRRRWGPWLAGAGMVLLWLGSMPVISRQLAWRLEEKAVLLTPAVLPQADAVVVLGGGMVPPLPPRRQVEVNGAGDRLLTGIDLMDQGLAPWLIVSGGEGANFTAHHPASTQAQSAADLAGRLGVPADRLLVSGQGRNTAEEAVALNRLAQDQQWQSVLLVTSATHLPRSVATFRRLTGLTIIPVACDFQLPTRELFGRPTFSSVLHDVLPNSQALNLTSLTMKESLGGLVYRMRGWN